MTDNRHSIGATGDAEDEARGRPESFRHHGYGATEKDKLRYDTVIKQAFLTATKSSKIPEELRANIIIAMDSLRKAMKMDAPPDVVRYMLNAMKALEKELDRT